LGENVTTGIGDGIRLRQQRALTSLARIGLRCIACQQLLDEAADLVHGTLGAEECAIFEYVRGGDAFLMRAAVGWPPLDALPVVDRRPAPRLSTVFVALPGFGYLVVRGEAVGPGERAFIGESAQILGEALTGLAEDGRREDAALRDDLTGLPNRTLILDHLRLAIGRAERLPSAAAVLFLDLDRFKLINDNLGHETGDRLLIAVSERLSAVLRPADTLGRLGGDEFVVVCEDLAGEAEAMVVAERLAGALEAPFALPGGTVSIRASTGVTLCGPGRRDPVALVAEADAAMYRAKQAGSGHPVVFEDRMRISVDQRAARSIGFRRTHRTRCPGSRRAPRRADLPPSALTGNARPVWAAIKLPLTGSIAETTPGECWRPGH
jgi:diguanylate cyclase (GGDEF)-like protein